LSIETAFSPELLVAAVRKLFELNHYEVNGPVQVHGAEIDLIANRINDPFGSSLYLEVTVEYVDNDKYGKDMTKLSMVRENEPDATLLIVSSRGFSLPVKERAKATRITTITYAELFARFEQFDRYLSHVVGESTLATELRRLNDIYEEPWFEDKAGKDQATSYLSHWRDNLQDNSGWLIVVGEYGTGKTALTKILQHRWMMDYQKNPGLPIPIRIELREFSRQFDASGLLHHFLDHNRLSHISIDFVSSLIAQGRVILILDGYDEMAQYLLSRERRACLEALASLSAGGARGILTSRPNYFTENEELHVFDILYSSLKPDRFYQGRDARALLEREASVDRLLEQFQLSRFERALQDLNEPQTESLVKRILSHDEQGQKSVLRILRSIFRTAGEGDSKSLSGKPVIISYLLNIVEDLKEGSEARFAGSGGQLTEWRVYQMIIDNLMNRDFHRAPELAPPVRRSFLHKLSIYLSRADHPNIYEAEFRDLISKEFDRELRRFDSDTKAQQVEKLFADLRSSATLTRSAEHAGWRFSHNSLREFLVAEYVLERLDAGSVVQDHLPISDAMRLFAASRDEADLRRLMEGLASHWSKRGTIRGLGQCLALLWNGLRLLFSGSADPTRACLSAVCGRSLALNGIDLNRFTMSRPEQPSDLSHGNFSETNLAAVDFSGANLASADFSHAVLDAVNFSEADLHDAIFYGSTIEDANLKGAKVSGASFKGVAVEDISILVEGDGDEHLRRLEGLDALGFLKYEGGATDTLPVSAVLKHHPKFSIAEKIMEKLAEQSIRQRRGVEQRGEARRDVRFAHRFVDYLESQNLIRVTRRRKELIEVTDRGRAEFGRFKELREIPPVVITFFESE
jgi:uncharacterized protein YjbI with pentapeptide repeats